MGAPAKPKAPERARSCQDFLEEWMPRVRDSGEPVELDFSFAKGAITATDMRIPSALRTGVLYTREEVEAKVDHEHGDFDKRVRHFLGRT